MNRSSDFFPNLHAQLEDPKGSFTQLHFHEKSIFILEYLSMES
jgi:hypothetical protein